MTQITLLDGSIGQELVHRAGDRPTPMWSTSVMLDHPYLVADVHRDYFDCGATVATTNTYALHHDRLDGTGLEGQHTVLMNSALASAKSARNAHGSGRIAGALGPLGASYRPDMHIAPEEAAPIYAELVDMMRNDVDFFLIETVSSLEHAHGALLGCKGADRPVWLAVTVQDDDGTRLRSGEKTSDLANLVSEFTPDAVLVNCSRPEAIANALNAIKPMGRPFGAYANGFTHIAPEFLEDKPTVDALSARHDLSPSTYADFAMAWIDQGATIVGGCCEVGPAHISELANRLRDAGHEIV